MQTNSDIYLIGLSVIAFLIITFFFLKKVASSNDLKVKIEEIPDIYDDEIIGVKSTSIKFKKNPKIFIGTCYLISIILFIILSLNMMNKPIYLLLLIFPLFHYLYQL